MTDCSGAIETTGCRHLLTVSVAEPMGVLTARQRARQLAHLLGFDHQDQIRIATATSEIARNAVEYGRNGRVQFFIHLSADPPLFVVRVTDEGAGMVQSEAILEGRSRSHTGMGLGLSGTRRLMDRFSLESTPGKGSTVTFAKILPADAAGLDMQHVARLNEQLAREQSQDADEEMRRQSHELLVALDLIRRLESEAEKRQADMARLNQELEETNQGVVALYAELDERASELRRADDVKTRFLSYMSHEFRTPLNSILALSDLLLRRVDGDLTAEQEKQIGFVRAASYELFEMVNDLLDIAKVEAGKVDLRIGTIEVTKLFGGLRGMMRPLTHSENVSLVFEEPPEDLLIASDEGKINQILRNLISNALKFTERGEVRIRVSREKGQVVFSVSDTGIGIAPDDQEHIFREFAQIENPVQRKVRGTGLGLPLSRKLAELIGGTLTVTSALGAGSTFRLTMPLAVGDSVLAAGHSQSIEGGSAGLGSLHAAEEGSPESILVIDDQEVARYLTRQLFRGTRYLITEAAGGIEGVERARFDRPSLILLDINMHDRNGFEVLEDLKSDSATKDIPVVLHTSYSLTPDDISRLNGRHAAVLPKQAGDHDEAMAVIRELLGEPHLFSKQ
jgi:signal transduction histidine kinase/ActR/RegA family two-component response regulator